MAREEATVRRRRTAQQSQPTGTPSTPSTPASGENAAGVTRPPNSVRDALRQLLIRAGLMYLMYQYYWKKPAQPIGGSEDVISSSAGKAIDAPEAAAGLAGLLGMPGKVPDFYSWRLKSAWTGGEMLEFGVFVNLREDMTFEEARNEGGIEGGVWGKRGVKFATVDESYLKENITLDVPEQVREGNATWYAHVFVGKGGVWDGGEDVMGGIQRNVLYSKHELITWLEVDLRKQGKNLLGDDENQDEEEVEEEEEGEHFRYDQKWKPSMPITMVTNAGPVVLGQLPAPAARVYRVDVVRKEYYPPMQVNEFWMLRDSMREMNASVDKVVVEMAFEPMSLYKWSMYKQFDNVWERQVDMGTMKPGESDELKRMFVETNPVLLGTTMVVSLAHTVLEGLAFKNDISHWRNIKSMEGVSVRSMIWKIVMEAIIFLYLWDNDTSWMITIGNGVGLVIAVWKLGKAVKFENFGKRKLFKIIPWFDMVDRESYSKETKEYDDQAMKYMGYALYPLVAMYAGYSLMYEKHKSWYSWMINSLVGAVYAFGFIMMFPQIFINYKLKSVAHMPMKAMMYKTLNTVIDDLFSFIIKMPWLHRLACFRDDIVFLVLLYQRWIYPVDTKRVNEFGQQFDDEGKEKLVKPAEVSESTKTRDDDERKTADGKADKKDKVCEETSPTIGEEDEVEDKPSEEKKND